jgi:hypothetical protein
MSEHSLTPKSSTLLWTSKQASKQLSVKEQDKAKDEPHLQHGGTHHSLACPASAQARFVLCFVNVHYLCSVNLEPHSTMKARLC